MEDKIKILLCGDVEGRFNTLFNRVETIIKKSGPFDLMLCVGNFFGINNKEIEPYKSGLKKVPVSTYILGPNKEDVLDMYDVEDSQICPNVFYLGKKGLYKSTGGLKIAYISGVFSSNSTSECSLSADDLVSLKNICIRDDSNFKGVDILLTSQWPANVMNYDSAKKLTVNAATHFSSWLALNLRPRYHVSGLEGVHYERRPYRSCGGTDVSEEIVTRFIGLARVGNANKEKWIHALSLTPLVKMKIAELLQKTTDETPCPYDIADLERRVLNKKRQVPDGNQYFYDMNTYDENKKEKRAKKQRVEFDQSKCWFCLASPSVEKHLIVTVGSTVYLALAKGGLVDEHILICPIEHYQSSLSPPKDVLEEVRQFKEAIRNFYKRNDKVPVFFERNYKTSHMQIQSVPVPKIARQGLTEAFMKKAEDNEFTLEELEPEIKLDQVVPVGCPYFAVELPNGSTLYTRIQGSTHFPLNFGREVLASTSVLNIVDKSDWKECILKKSDEEKLVKRIQTDFEPFDIG